MVENGSSVPREYKRVKKEDFNKTVDIRNTPEMAIQNASDMESFVGRVGAVIQIALDTGEIKHGWQVARMIEKIERGDDRVTVDDLPSALGIKAKFLQLKSEGV